ncbi:MAG: DUF3794 domain-containing protein [Clostridia bacterium]|nr:DUF3794 domain-containing protein [Clostridia bacterium]
MNFQYEKIAANCLKKVATVDRVVEFVASGVESGNVARVLGLIADARTVSVEALADEATYLGRVNFKMLYLDTDGEPRSLDYFADFNEKIKAEISAGCTLNGQIGVLETDITTDGELKLSAVVEITMYAMDKLEDECLVSTPEDCYDETAMIEVPMLVGVKSADIEVSDEKAVGGDISRVLLADTVVAVNELRAGDGLVFVGGDFEATVTYYEDDEIKTANFHIPFTEEVLFDGVSIGDSIVAYPSIKTTRVVLTGVEGDNVLRIESLVSVKLFAFSRRMHNVIGDVFMLSNELEVEKVEQNFCALEKCIFVSDKYVSSAMLADSRPAVRDIIGVISSQNSIAGTKIEDDKLIIEGVVGANLLYTDENGFNSVKAELPYSLNFKTDVPQNAELRVSGIVEDISARVKRDREIEVTTKLEFCIEVWVGNSCVMLKKVVIGEEKELNQSAISVFIASSGDSIWDVAKALSATPKSIITQNPNVEGGLKDGDKVMYFRQLNISF